MGIVHSELRRAFLALAALGMVAAAVPGPAVRAADQAPKAARVLAADARGAGQSDLDPAEVPLRFSDDATKLSIVPPAGWIRAPATSLNPPGEPADSAQEVARFQVHVGDSSLYAQPIPVTSGLLADAGAVLTVALARKGSVLAGIKPERFELDEARSIGGFVSISDELAYEGVVTHTRYLFARGAERVVVLRAQAPAAQWKSFAPKVRATMDSFRGEPSAPNAAALPEPVAVAASAPEPPSSAPQAAIPSPDAIARSEILARAAVLLGTPYRWGGNLWGKAMDCSAYVSAAWAVSRYTTDSIGTVSYRIGKDELLPGDALNLESWRDPGRRGHIRIFAAWGNAARSLVWVYEETPPRAIYRVIAYDSRYQPIRLASLGGEGVAPIVPARAPARDANFAPGGRGPRERSDPEFGSAGRGPRERSEGGGPWERSDPTATRKPAPKPTPGPKASHTPRPKPSHTPKPTAKATPKPGAQATPKAGAATPKPAVPPTPTPRGSGP